MRPRAPTTPDIPRSFGFLIFAGSADDADADLRLLYKNTAVTQTASEMSMTGSLGDYTVNLDLPHTTVEHLLGRTAAPSSPTPMPRVCCPD